MTTPHENLEVGAADMQDLLVAERALYLCRCGRACSRLAIYVID
jgi:hypothetical protein